LGDANKCSCAGTGPACYAKIPFKLVAAACRLFHMSPKSSQDALLWSLQVISTEDSESSSGDSDHDIDRRATQRRRWFFEGWFVITLCVCLFLTCPLHLFNTWWQVRLFVGQASLGCLEFRRDGWSEPRLPSKAWTLGMCTQADAHRQSRLRWTSSCESCIIAQPKVCPMASASVVT